MRVVVVGASSGLGRCLAVGLAKRGAQVALMARRKARLESAVEEIGANAIAVECDVTDEASTKAAVDEAATAFAGIDAIVYSPAYGPLRKIEDIDAQTWRDVFDTNVVGAAVVTAAALPHLQATGGNAAYLSSVAGSLTPPWPGLAAYGVSKAALDRLIESWRMEHPSVNFTRVVVGECMAGEGEAATEFSSHWDLQLAGEYYPVWMQRGYMSGALIDVEDLISVVDAVLRTKATIPSVAITPRPSAIPAGLPPDGQVPPSLASRADS